MIDHLVIHVSNLQASRAFYAAVLTPLGMRVRKELDNGVLFGAIEPVEGEDPDGEFCLVQAEVPRERPHFAFRARTREQVDRFYHAALAAGGVDNGQPGLRPRYHADYYAAFVRDPDDYNIEAVCHEPAA
ncbi:VOC family protein [Stutzerimonas stutzeri]|uniref:VOC family protein n=1 Tax=Stutzerimonas stutzeri TaxID=316 RepID=A0A6I6LPC6_STUST|nr:VOC family protein [Stutzerimonas stutzeri]QGZ30216.1 VOC family protein [Stutzerimonas stutzeri]